jgi:hypothetical protein
MRCTPGARLALVLLLVCAPAARADGPLGPGRPCTTLQQVTDAISFATGFPIETKACAKLCKKAGATCAKQVNRGVTCNRKSITDSSFFQEQVSCAGQRGSALKACRSDLEGQKKTDLADLDGQRTTALGVCDTQAQQCAEHCTHAP